MLAGCPDRAKSPPGARQAAVNTAPTGKLCKSSVRAALLPPDARHIGPGRWSVQLDLQGEVLAAHRARFSAKKIEPNGEAWAGLLEQCVTAATLAGVHLDPEAGSLHAWVETDADKDRFVAALCKAVDDADWLDRCLARIDRSRLDD
ncbi:MAG: hypothetical protein JWN44_4018 [Myxococcales bacterium]|nr:hypothetical protein [Myxococcales bacterium]